MGRSRRRRSATPNLRIGEAGTGRNSIVTPYLSIDGEAGVIREGGTALILHTGTDDYFTDPGGRSGDRIGRGVIGGG